MKPSFLKLMICSFYFLSALFFSAVSWAELTAKDLLGDCEVKIRLEEGKSSTPIDSTDAFRAGACTGYIKGFDDMEIIYASIIASPSNSEKEIQKYSLYCLPAGTSNTQMTKVIARYIKNHPEEWDNAASLAAGKALRLAFPCPQTK